MLMMSYGIFAHTFLYYFRLIQRAALLIQKVQQQGKDAHDAWNLSSVSLVKAAEVKITV